MRRSAWTVGAAVLAALSLGVAACGGSDDRRRIGNKHANTGTTTAPDKAKTGGKLTVLWTGDVDSHRLRPDLLPDGQLHLQRDAEAAVRATSPTTARRWSRTSPRAIPRSPRTARPSRSRSRRASSTRRRTTRRSRPSRRQVRDRARLLQPRRPTASRSRYFADLEGAKIGAKPGTKITGIDDARRPRRSCSSSSAPVGGVMAAGALAYGATAPVPEDVRQEVRRQDAVDLRRAPARHRPVHDRERRVGQGDRL